MVFLGAQEIARRLETFSLRSVAFVVALSARVATARMYVTYILAVPWESRRDH